MNFTWLVTKGINDTWTFFALGLGSMIATCVGMIMFFKRRGWI